MSSPSLSFSLSLNSLDGFGKKKKTNMKPFGKKKECQKLLKSESKKKEQNK